MKTNYILYTILVSALTLIPVVVMAQDTATQIIEPPYKILYHQNTSGISLEKATVTVQLFDQITPVPVSVATVKILVESINGNQTGWAHAIPLTETSNVYVAELNLKASGEWETNLEITRQSEVHLINVQPIFIRETASFSAGTVVFWSITVIICVGAFLIYRSAPNRKKGANT